MKKFFRLVSMLAVAGLTFAYTSCTDYSEDVNRLDERIDGHVADVNTQIESLKKTDAGLQTSIDAANAAIEALQDNTASLKDELTKLSEKHDADIKALSATHAADKAAIEKALADKAAELKTALDNLNAEYTRKFSDLEAAYKQADVELKSQILQNVNKITDLENDVKNIKDVLIPAVNQQIEELAAKADETYATKVALTDSTAKLAGRITSEVAKLNYSIKTVSDRLTDLETAHKTLKESFEQTKDLHSTAISDLQAKLATLEASHKTDIEAVKDLVMAAQEAADAAQAAADAAKAAADNAQATADNAVTAAANAQTAAEAAQATATEALGKVDALIEALGAYAEAGKLEAKFKELADANSALALKAAELALADAELAKKYETLADKDKNFDELITGIQTQLAQIKGMKQQDSILAENIKAAREDADSKVAAAKEYVLQELDKLSETLEGDIEGVYNYIGVEDGKLKQKIDSLAEVKFNKADFAVAFKEAYELRFDHDFDNTFTAKFQTAFGDALKSSAFNEAFDKALEAAITNKKLDEYFNGAFTSAINTAIAEGGVVDEKIKEKVNDAKTDLEEEIKSAKDALQTKINNVNTKVGDILLVVNELADRIQSVTFVPEYDDFAATLYYYAAPIEGADGQYIYVPISGTKTVVANFEVYPKSQALKVADMLMSGNGASLVAVPLKAYKTRGAAEAPKAKIKSAVAANGVVSIEAVFDAEVPYDFEYNVFGSQPKDMNAVSFAIALRVESPAVSVVRDSVTATSGTSVDAGRYIESAYVPVKFSMNSLLAGFCLYDFEKKVEFDDACVEKQWSEAPAEWKYFDGFDYAVRMSDRTGKECIFNLEDAAKLMNIDVEEITPKFTVKAKVGGKANANAKYFTPKADSEGFVTFGSLADCNIAMNTEEVKADVKDAVGNEMKHSVDFNIENIGNVCHYDLGYKIIRRQVKFNVVPFEGKNRIDWSYATAVDLTSDKASGDAYDKPITFVECSVERVDENDLKVNLGQILKLTPKYVVTLNGEEQKLPATATPIQINKVADLVHDVAEVVIPGGAYKFAQGMDNSYVVKSVYSVEDNQTDYNVIFNYVLGAMPVDQVVKLPKMKIPFESGEKFFKKMYEKEDYMPQLGTLVPYFKDVDQLWASINELYYNSSATIKYYNGEMNDGGFTDFTNLNITTDGLVVGIDKRDLNSFYDTFGFCASRETWYGVTYKFENSDIEGITFVRPDFRLAPAPAPDRLNADWTGTIRHEAKYDKYVLKQDIDLSKYVTVANYDEKETELKITYAPKTEADADNGIVNVPVINTTEVAVIPNPTASQFPTIESSYINWLTWSTSDKRGTSFTAREYQISVVLNLDGVYLDGATMTLSTPSPITKFAFDEFVQTIPEGSTSTTVRLWNKMIIEGVLEDGNIAKQDASTLTGAIYGKVNGKKTNPNTYDCVVSFPSADKVNVYVGGVLQPVYNLKKFTYDAAKGEITFTGDLADLVQPVKFEFEATLNYVLDYNNTEPKIATVSVTFQK